MECCVCKKNCVERKRRLKLFGGSQKAVSAQKSILAYLQDTGKEDVTVPDLKYFFPYEYICHTCYDIVTEYQTLKDKFERAEKFMHDNIACRVTEVRSPCVERRRMPYPIAMSTPKRPRVAPPSSPPVQVHKLSVVICVYVRL